MIESVGCKIESRLKSISLVDADDQREFEAWCRKRTWPVPDALTEMIYIGWYRAEQRQQYKDALASLVAAGE